MADEVKNAWEKVVSAVKSAPATFGYGVIVGVLAGAILF